jgi:hypothetical protein
VAVEAPEAGVASTPLTLTPRTACLLASNVCSRTVMADAPTASIYSVTIANPGERKSAVQREMTRPLLDVEQELIDTSHAARTDAEVRKHVATKAAERQTLGVSRATVYRVLAEQSDE